ncbi:MAG: ABC transporter permease [Blastocatellia bacterium]|nr:ABC transporter permease [Blastocatellia bacterium]
MERIIRRRLLGLLPLLAGLALLSFLLLQIAPGDVLSDLRLNPQVSEETLADLRRKYGLDRPWYVQFGRWLWGIVRGDFGHSFLYNRPAGELVGERAFNTIALAAGALGMTVAAAAPAGALAARYRAIERAGAALSTIALSVPSLLLAIMAMQFAAKTSWFPIGGVSSLEYESLTAAGKAADYLHHLVLPALTLALRQLPGWFRNLHTGMREALAEDFILAARAKGLPEASVLFKHALRNALNPLITMFGSSMGSLLSGAFVIEVVMSWPGIGSLAVSSLLNRDLYVLMACLMYAAILMALGNLLADLLLLLADPRLRRGETTGGA